MVIRENNLDERNSWNYSPWSESQYTSYCEMAKKGIEGGMFLMKTSWWSRMHRILKWLSLKMAKNLDHVLYFWSELLIEFWANSEFCNWNKARDQEFEPFWGWIISKSDAYDFRWNMPSSMSFWAISQYLAYS